MSAWTILGADIYIDENNGDDITGDGTIGNPYASLNKGITEMNTLDNIAGQYKMVIGAGVYEENIVYIAPDTANLDLIIEGDGLVILDGDGDFAVGGTGLTFKRTGNNVSATVRNITVKNYPVLVDRSTPSASYHWKYVNCNFINGSINRSNNAFPWLSFCTFTDVILQSSPYTNYHILSGTENCNFRGCEDITTSAAALSVTNCDFDSGCINTGNNTLNLFNCNYRGDIGTGTLNETNPITGDPLYVDGTFVYKNGSPNLYSGTKGRNVGARGLAIVATNEGVDPLSIVGGATHTNVAEVLGTYILIDTGNSGTIESSTIDIGTVRTVGAIRFFGDVEFDPFTLDSQAGTPAYSYELKWGQTLSELASASYHHMRVGVQPRFDGTYGNGDINYAGNGNFVIARYYQIKITINP
jgi:hypothetical protein